MSEKIPNANEVRNWYFKALEFPSFIGTLNPYEKEELKQYAKNQIKKITDLAINAFSVFPEEKYPNDLPIEKRYEFVFNYHFKNVSTISEANFILNLFGWHWTVKDSYHRIEKPQPESKGLIVDKEIRNQLIEDLKPYFKNDSHKIQLGVLFKGNKINHTLDFEGESNQLISVFVNLKKGGKYLRKYSQRDLAIWLSENFTYWTKSKKKYIPIKQSTAEGSFSPSKEDSYLPNKEDEISRIH